MHTPQLQLATACCWIYAAPCCHPHHTHVASSAPPLHLVAATPTPSSRHHPSPHLHSVQVVHARPAQVGRDGKQVGGASLQPQLSLATTTPEHTGLTVPEQGKHQIDVDPPTLLCSCQWTHFLESSCPSLGCTSSTITCTHTHTYTHHVTTGMHTGTNTWTHLDWLVVAVLTRHRLATPLSPPTSPTELVLLVEEMADLTNPGWW